MARYQKKPLSIDNQVSLLKSRGLSIPDTTKAKHFLSNISFYRLRAYTYTFQDNSTSSNHEFVDGVSFDDIIGLYVFDRKLRLFVFDALEKIEVSLRAQLVYHLSQEFGSHWHLNGALFTDAKQHESHLKSLRLQTQRSKEQFIGHYFGKYNDPEDPACWMSLEVVSFGLLSKLFSNLKKSTSKKMIPTHYGIKSIGVAENWFSCFTVLRNICAHHSRLYNRALRPIAIPRKFAVNVAPTWNIQENNTLYAYLCIIVHILDIISPDNSFRKRLFTLIEEHLTLETVAMGFPIGWREQEFWKG